MGRKNRNASRVRLARRVKGESRPPKIVVARVQVEDLVLPDGQCRFQGKRPKARFATAAKAKKALEQAKRQRAATGSGHVEKRYYACPEGGCGGYHLTSRETYDEEAWKRRQKGRTS